jgi:hypothetical protein
VSFARLLISLGVPGEFELVAARTPKTRRGKKHARHHG